jgi:hypothetical protein
VPTVSPDPEFGIRPGEKSGKMTIKRFSILSIYCQFKNTTEIEKYMYNNNFKVHGFIEYWRSHLDEAASEGAKPAPDPGPQPGTGMVAATCKQKRRL